MPSPQYERKRDVPRRALGKVPGTGETFIAMTTNPSDAALLDEAHAAFIQSRVTINLGARDADNVATLTRALGCRVSADRRLVTVFVSVPRSRALLDDVRANGAIAVVITRPSTHQTIQLKGTDAVIAPIADGDRATIAEYVESFVEDLVGIGYKRNFARIVLTGMDDEVVAVTFTPTAAFAQTPGPGAGARLRT
jgi:hypothetical protein